MTATHRPEGTGHALPDPDAWILEHEPHRHAQFVGYNRELEAAGSDLRYAWEWHVDRDWYVITWRRLQCRWTDKGRRCPFEAVAMLERNKRSYCPDHLFGRLWWNREVWSCRPIQQSKEPEQCPKPQL